MANEITANGLETKSLDEIIAELNAAFQSIYGEDINLESNSPDGQMIGITAQQAAELLDLATQVYNSFDPDAAFGAALDARVAINGLQRGGATYTIAPVSITVDRALTLPGLDQEGTPFTVADASGNQFQLVTTQTPAGAGTNSYNFRASNPGAVQVQTNSITSQVTVVVGVTAVNNPTGAGTIGVDEESDADLKVRRQASLAISGSNSLDAMRSNLNNLTGVSDARVWENYLGTPQLFTGTLAGDPPVEGAALTQAVSGATATVSAIKTGYLDITGESGTFDFENEVTGVNPDTSEFTFTPVAFVKRNSMWAIVEGGTAADIGEAIYTYRSAGCGMNGEESEIVDQPNGDPFEVLYDLPVYVPIYIQFYLTAKRAGVSYDAATVKAYIADNISLKLYESIGSQTIYDLLAQIAPNHTPTDVELSVDETNWSEILTPASPQQKFSLDAANIDILE